MKLFFKILFFVLAIFQTNISEAKVFVFDVVVSERIPTVNEVKVKNYPTEISENDFGISCKSKNDFVDYSNLGLGAEEIAAKGGAKLLPQFASSTIDDAVALTMKQKELHIFANKLHPKPWLNQLSTQMGGNQNVIKSALQNANGRILPNAQGVFNTPVNVGGVNFTIRGYINQGKPIINSIFIP